MEMFERLNHFGFALFALFVLMGAIGGAGVVSANTHTADVDLSPEWSAAGESVDYSMEVCNNGPDAIDEVRVIKNPLYTTFDCVDKSADGWTTVKISPWYDSELGFTEMCWYYTLYPEDNIEDGYCDNFDFTATVPSTGNCNLIWKIETRDEQATGSGNYETWSDTTSVDSLEPSMTKEVIGIQSGTCPPGEGDTCWITQSTYIKVSVQDEGICDPSSGLDYCEITYTVDGAGPYQEVYDDLDGEQAWEYTFNFGEDSVHELTVHCADRAGNEMTDIETFKVDSTPPETTKTYGSPRWPQGDPYDINDPVAPYPHFITTETPITLTEEDGGDVCAIGTEVTYYKNLLLPDEAPCYDDAICDSWAYDMIEQGNFLPYEGAFTKDEESCHIIFFYSVDLLGNEEDVQWQCVNVDDTPPVGIKEVEEGENVLWDETVLAADRIMALQAGDGSWDWMVTSQSGPTGTTYLNIAGVTAEVLLDAYEITGDPKYLDAAKDAGDYLIAQVGDPSSSQRQNAFSMVFLYHLADASGDSAYSDEADAMVDHVLNEENYWSLNNGNHCTSSGCTAAQLRAALEDYRSWSTDPSGIVVWDLFHFIEAAQTAGEASFADDMAGELDAYMSQAGFDDSIEYYVLGLSAGIMGLDNAGEDYSAYMTALLAEQNPDGSFSVTEPIQGTAYALMALEAAGETDAAEAASLYLVDSFGYSSYDGWKESDGEEYSEVTSEAAQALADVIMNEGTWVSQDTEITLTCTDPQPHPVGEEAVCFIVSYDDADGQGGYGYITDRYCSELGGTLDGDVCCVESDTVTLEFKEDSVHDLEYYCRDGLYNTGDSDFEWFRVDTEEPYLVDKWIEGPYYAVEGDCPPDSEDDQCHLDGSSYIYIDVEDGGDICDVGVEWCHWWYYLDGERVPAGSDYYTYDPAAGIHFPEETEHVLHVKCRDYLGNVFEEEETFYVDKTPPETTKTYGEPYFEEEGVEWIDTSTEITLTATDDVGDHDSGVKATYYRYLLVSDEACWSDTRCQEMNIDLPSWQEYTEGQPFTIGEESCHMIEFYSVDNVEKEETPNRQCVFVEDDAPTLEKVVGDPKVPCSECTGTATGFEPCFMLGFEVTPDECEAIPGCSVFLEYGCNGDLEMQSTCYDIGYDYDECLATDGCYWDYWCGGTPDCSGMGEDTCGLVDGCEWTTNYEWCDYYVTQNTDITFTCEDQGDHPVDHERFCFKVSYDYVETEPGVYDWGYITEQYCDQGEMTADGYCCMDMYEQPGYAAAACEGDCPDGDGRIFEFYFEEDSMHNLEYYCEDALGHNTGTHVQYYKVDTTEPEITKIMNEPYYGDCPPEPDSYDECYVDTATSIDVETEDGGDICAVGDVQCRWAYEVYDVTGAVIASSDWIYEFPIIFPEESHHTLYLECWDALGNTATDIERFIVDKSPPVIEKDYGDPYLYGSGPEEYITSETPIYIDVYDPEPHPSGVAEVEYRVTLLEDESYCWEPQTCEYAEGSGNWEAGSEDFEFNIPDDSCHLIEVHAVDNVGKESTHKQCVFVDNQAPDPEKTVGEPNSKIYPDDYVWQYYPEVNGNCWTGEEGSIDCWKVTTLTPIVMSCDDPDPHPVGEEMICFHVDFDAMDYTEQHCDPNAGGELVFDEEMNKTVCCYEYWEYKNEIQDGVWLYFGEESEHELEFFCEDALGNRGPVDIEKFKVEGTAFEIPIFQKWNLISVPFQLLDSDPEAVFENVSDEVDIVWTYDGETGLWYRYTPDGLENDNIESIDPGWGYWVFGNEDTELKIGGSLFEPGPYVPVERLLSEGWNLIGYYGTEWQDYNKAVDPCEYGRGLPFFNNVYNSLYSLMDVTVMDPEDGDEEWAEPNFDSLYTYQTCGITDPYNQPYWLSLEYDDKMYPGYGFWIHMDEEDMYAPTFKELENDWCWFPWCHGGFD